MWTGLQKPDDLELVRYWNSSLVLIGFHVCFLPLLCCLLCFLCSKLKVNRGKLLSETNLLTTYEDEKVIEKPAVTVVAKPSWLFLLCMVQSFMLLVLIFYIVKRGKNYLWWLTYNHVLINLLRPCEVLGPICWCLIAGWTVVLFCNISYALRS